MQFYFKITSRGQKYGGFLLNCTNIPMVFWCWKSRLWGDSKIEFVFQARRKEIKFHISYWRNATSYNWLSITQNLRREKTIIRIKHEICPRQWEFEFLYVNFYKFSSEEISEIVWFLFLWSVFKKVLYGVWRFKYSSYQESAVFINFQNFLLKFKENPSKIFWID